MSKQQVLTERDVERYQLNPEILRYLEAYVERHALEPEQVRVLDFGCGRGEAVVKLQRMGFDAVGVDIDPLALENGRRYLAAAGIDRDRLLQISPEGRVAAPDGHFQFVFSETVLEHVSDLEQVACEMSRLMAPEGEGLHIFPARHHFVEQHLRMPLVHWLPKNGLRTGLIGLFVLVGIEPHWEAEGRRAKIRRYSRYSRQNTFYRPPRDLKALFIQQGFRVRFVSIDHPKLAGHPVLGRLVRWRGFRSTLGWLLLSFKTVELHLRRTGVRETLAAAEHS